MALTSSSTLKLTYEHYVLFPDDGNRHEIIDGRHYMNPAPSTYHQIVSKRLQYELYTQIELENLGVIFSAPVDVQLSEFDIVQPDLVALCHQSRARVTPTKIIGPPEMLIEILSPTSIRNDIVLKKSLYQQSGVREYWIVDPFEHRIRQFALCDNLYDELTLAEDVLVAHTFPTLKITLATIW